MSIEQRNVEYEQHHVEKKYDSSLVASTFIKYTAYVLIFFGVLYFLARYIIPKF